MGKKVQSAEYYKSYLHGIYQSKLPFEVHVIDKKPKTRMGSYSFRSEAPSRIRIYAKWHVACPLEEIAIHEYAHHIHATEKGGIYGRGKNRTHGEIFWRIYSALMAEAIKKRLFDDPLISNIIKR